MRPLPKVLGPTELSNSFLGDFVQVCIVTRDHRKVMAGMVNLGIGPWEVRVFDERMMSKRMYRGRPSNFTMTICHANSRDMNWEIVEPISGPSIYDEFIERHSEGVQHLAFNYGGIDHDERLKHFADRGYASVQSGVLLGSANFEFLETDNDIGTMLEIFSAPPGFTMPPPERWFPAAPPG
jgi:hypothetical protein